VRLVVNKDADVNNTYTYNAFGEMFPAECAETVYNPFKFTGQWFDSEIGQYYLRARMYDPVLMRFASIDPVKGKFRWPLTLHPYLYCLNEPINHIDPNGQLALNVANSVLTGSALYAHGIDLAIYAVAFENEKFWKLAEITFEFMPTGMSMAAVLPRPGWGLWKHVYTGVGSAAGFALEQAFHRTGMSIPEGLAMEPAAFLSYSSLMYGMEIKLDVSGADMEDFAEWHGPW